jgi:TonB-dependent starch-binding outer membrane protein SusC
MAIKKLFFAVLLSMCCFLVNAQNVTGKVRAKTTGKELEGATVTVKGTKTNTLTDASGSFSIAAEKGATLVISFVGYTTSTIKINNTAALDVELTEIDKALDEVVVIGYGTKKRKDLSTAISSISAKEISKAPVADAAQALQGKVSGVTITQSSGAPGGTGGSKIRIRGISSVDRTNNPLIVVDGYPLPDQEGDNVLNSFGTGDIETIDVLKDAAAASIYGVRASNGVIIITTKRGKAGKTSLTLDVYRGIQQAWQLPTMLNAREYAIINSEAAIASGRTILPKLADYNAIEQQYGKGTNWLNEIFRKAAVQSVNLTATGGSDKAQYSFSAGYFKQDGIVYKTDFERFNLRFNGDVKVNKNIKIGNSLSMNKFIEHGADTYNPFNSVIILALTSPPTIKPRNADGTYAGGNGAIDGFSEPNPIFQLEVPQINNSKYRLTGNVFAEISFLHDFKFKALFGGDYVYQETSVFNPYTVSTGGSVSNPVTRLSSFGATKGLYPDYLAEYTLGYDKVFYKKHKLNTIIGYTFQENRGSFLSGSRSGNFLQPIGILNQQVFPISDPSQINNESFERLNRRFISYFGRLNYDFDNRGFLSFSIRRDGSSVFAPKNQFATFPSVSAAWRLSEEPFLKNVKWIDELKVRGSFGYTGNPDVPAYEYIQNINQSFQYTLGNSAGSNGLVTGAGVSRTYNPDIRWEKNEQIDFGIDASLFKNKLGIALDFYQRRSIDLILGVAPPLLSGTYETVYYNTGTLQNRGIDLSLNYKVISHKDFNWQSNAVISTYKNKVISLGKSVDPYDRFPPFARIQGGSLRSTKGSPIDFFYGFVTDGIFQNTNEIANHAVQTAGTNPNTSTAPGDIRFKDLNGDGIINDEDRTNIGNANPTFTYGLTNTLSYKNFEVTLFIQGSQGNKVLNFTRWYTEGGVSNGNYSNEVLKRWVGPGTSNTQPRVTLEDPNKNNRVSDRFVEDASYLRIKNLRIAYNLPSKWSTLLNLKKAQFYVSSQNLATLTNYSGLDPEVGGAVDYGFYPQAKTFIAGVTVDF